MKNTVFFHAHQAMQFFENEKDKANCDTFIAKPGFNSAPGWVAGTDLFKLAQTGTRPFIKVAETGAKTSDLEIEATVKENMELRKQLEEMERKLEAQKEAEAGQSAPVETPEVPEIELSDRDKLEKEAAELGIKYIGTKSDETLTDEIAAAKEN